LRSVRNVLTGRQEIKTERALRTWMLRFLGREYKGKSRESDDQNPL
jgi:hypothetical protein